MVFLLAVAGLPVAAQGQTTPSSSLAYRTFQSLVISRWCATGPVCAAEAPARQIATILDSVRLEAVPRIGSLPLSPSSVQSIYDGIDTIVRDSLEQSLEEASLKTASAPGLGTGPLGATVVSGLTDFLLQRARDEVVQSVFRDLARLFENNSDLATLFPNLHAMVRAADNLTFRTLIPALRVAGEEDLRKLPVNVADPGLSFWSGGVPWEVQAVSLIAQRATDVMSGVPFEESAAKLANLSRDQLGQDDVRTAFRLIGMLARERSALQLAHSAHPKFAKWVGNVASGPIERLLENQTTRRVFLTILLYDLEADGLRNLVDSANDTVDRILNAYRRIRSIESFAQQSRNNATSFDVLRAVSEALDIAGALVPPDVRPRAERALATARGLLRMLQDRDHGQLLLVVVSAIPEKEGDAGKALVKLKRVVALAAALADASSSEGVRHALEAWADPVGSFRERRRSGAVRVSVVSYVGVAGGVEWVQDVVPDMSVKGEFAGMFVPVGLELSFGLGDASLGIMASMLNVGTLASLRLGGLDAETATDTLAVSSEPEFGLQHIFAPGVWVTLGITGRYPVAIGFGVEYAPNLRAVEGDAGTVERNALRVVGFIGVDLTLFRF
jgi:hypothetical protein